jgi:hypothetical protein
MPSVSDKQHRFMEAVAHDPKFAAAHKISPSVGKDFVAADKAKAREPKMRGMVKPPETNK